MKTNQEIKNFEDLLEWEFGPKGSPDREEYERSFEAFKLGVLIRQARKEAKMTQKDLADKTGTKRSYISRIENDASDIRLSTLMRIVEVGLGGKLEIRLNTKSAS
jgi:HTH-type transcriptional regulator/antitoxin HipB